MKIGIYGGTFDPVHNEHVEIAEHALTELGLDQLIILPTGNPPHKNERDISDKKRRFKMCELAFTNEKMVLSDYEMEKQTKCYTFETLEHFSGEDRELFFILGGDSLKDIYGWKNPERIFELATIVTVGRRTATLDQYIKSTKEKIIALKYEPKEISSTEIRVRRQFGQDVSDVIPSVVASYIEKHELYQKYRKMTKRVEKELTPERYLHTVNTTVCGVRLAKKANVPFEDAFVACALHDIAKCKKDFSKYEKKLRKENMLIPLPVMHSFVGSYIVKDEFDIKNKDIRNAIKYHTTARPAMTALEKVVYVADCIEDGRDYPGVKQLREMAKHDFENAFRLCLNSTFSVIGDKTMCPLTLDAIDYYAN